MLKRLATMGLIEMIPWRGVFLTAEGEKLAQESRERHQIVENFLLVLGVSPEIARRDAVSYTHLVYCGSRMRTPFHSSRTLAGIDP